MYLKIDENDLAKWGVLLGCDYIQSSKLHNLYKELNMWNYTKDIPTNIKERGIYLSDNLHKVWKLIEEKYSNLFIKLNNATLLRKLEKAINNHSYLHLMVRSQLDYANTTPTAANGSKVWFDGIGDTFNDDLKLVIVYKKQGSRTNAGRPRSSSSGMSETHISAGTKSGFGGF